MRGGLSFKGVGVKTATFKLAVGITAADEGKAVTLAAADTAGLGAANDVFLGKLVKVEGDGYGTVEYSGFLQVPYNPAATPVPPTVGKFVVVDGAGGVKNAPEQAVNEGGAATYSIVEKGRGLVVSLDTVNNIATVLV